MFLSLSTLPVYLSSRGHLAPKQWIKDGCELCRALGRHSNFIVRDASGTGFFLKQIRATSPELIAAQENEARILSAIARFDVWSGQRTLLPRLIDHDQARHVLLIQYVAGKCLYEKYLTASTADDAASLNQLASIIGKRLAQFHTAGRRAVADPRHPALNTTLPVAITLQPPDPDFHANLSPACRHVIDSIQNDTPFIEQLQANRRFWHPDTLVHGDLKWDNVIVSDETSPQKQATSEPSAVKFVDWELASLGDPAWDVAGMLQSFTIHEAEQAKSPARTGVPDTRRDADFFWAAYIDEAEPGCDQPFTDRVRRFFAARLIQSVLEREYRSSSLSAVSAQLISISRSILCQDFASLGPVPAGPIRHG